MVVSNAQYTEDGTIKAEIDGFWYIVPDDFSNRDRQLIANWQEETGGEILPYTPPNPTVDVVSARQFKLRLFYMGLLDAVEAWVSSQTKDVQIAFEYSGSFVKDSPMMQEGFSAMGFTEAQINDFFIEASKL